MSKISRIGVIGIPYNVGWKGEGIADGSYALRQAGLLSKLKEVAECSNALRVVKDTDRLCGLAVMVFNARKDPEGTEARRLNQLIVDILR